MKRILISLMAILLAVGLVGGGAFAYFNDTETSSGNTFTAGTLDLKVNGKDDPEVVSIQLGDIKPGYSELFQFWLKNTGNLDGTLSVEISAITNNDNGCTEPEEDAEESQYGVGMATCGGDPDGELGQYLKTKAAVVDSDGTTTTCFLGPTLNDIGGETFTVSGKYGLLEADETQAFKMFVELPKDTGNIVQSDSVEFDIIFHLDQVTP